MTPLQTFRYVRPPTTTALVVALALWSTWWLADQFRPQVFGLQLLPIPLALCVALTMNVAFRWQTNIKHVKHLGKSRVYLYGTVLIIAVFGVLMLHFENERLAQVCYTVLIGAMGALYFAFACFSPNDIKSTSRNPDRPLDEFAGLYSISGLGMIGMALTSAALIDRVDDVIWVFAISIGALFYNYLLRWVAVLWLWSRTDTTE